MPSRAAIYLRNSDPRQAAKETHLPQLAEARAKAGEVGAEVMGVYSDAGKSAKTGALAARGDFARLVEDAQRHAFDLVIVANVDRLTRTESFAELGRIYGPLQDAGVKVVTTGGQVLDLQAPDGQLLAMFEAWRGAQENAARSARTKRGRAAAARAGRPSSQVPQGFRFDRATSTWGFDEDAEMVREMFRRIAAGESTTAIAGDLHRRGFRRPRGGKWDRERVYRLVVSPCYRGEWLADRERKIVIKLPQLVDDDLWYAAQERLLDAKRRGLRKTKRHYLLEGIARCAAEKCGDLIHIHSTTDYNGAAYAYYQCKRRRRRPFGETCTLPNQQVREIDARAWAAVTDFLSRQDLIDEAIALRRGSSTPWAQDLVDYEARLARLDDVELAVLDRHRRNLVSQRALDVELGRIARDRAMLERQIETARAGKADDRQVHALVATVATLRERLGAVAGDAAQRQRLMRALVPGRGDYVWRLGDGTLEATAVLGELPALGLTGDSDCRRRCRSSGGAG